MKFSNIEHVLTFELEDKLMMSNSDSIKNTIKADIESELKKSSINTVIIDLQKVNFVDSTGVGVFISIYKFLVEKQINFKLLKPQEIVNKVLTITKLGNIIEIEM